MRNRPAVALVFATAAAAALALTAAPASAATATSGCAGATHCYEMNEAPGATVMHDSGTGPIVNGSIGAHVTTGVVWGGATAYRFPRLKPNTPPADPQHIVTIPDGSSIDPGDANYTITVRYRTTNAFGNIIQKGQSATRGGQFKIQLPKGRPSCYFKGSAGRVGIGWTSPINDGQWHTIVCTRTASRVTFSVDGAPARVKNGVSGTIDNKVPLSIGGKPNCDQITTTCDYFGGDIDYVSIRKF